MKNTFLFFLACYVVTGFSSCGCRHTHDSEVKAALPSIQAGDGRQASRAVQASHAVQAVPVFIQQSTHA